MKLKRIFGQGLDKRPPLIYYYKIIFLLAFFLVYSHGFSQTIYNGVGHIPYEYQTDWTVAGLLPNTPVIANNLYDVTEQPGATWDEKMTNALDKATEASGTSIIYLPALPGRRAYVFTQPIVLRTANGNNIIFQGDGADATLLEFDMPGNNNCFDIRGDLVSNETANLNSDLLKRESAFTVDNAPIFQSGDWIHLEQPEFDYDQTTSWRALIGQITQITDVTGNTITIKDEANKYYLPLTGQLPDHQTRITGMIPIRNIGFENLKISRLGSEVSSASDLGYNVYFQYAVNCWIKGVEMEKTAKNHIGINASSHVEVSGCFIHRSISYGSGGYGYGVNLTASTTNCLIENNVFRRLRHALLVANGSNGNVLSYNYSREQHWTGLGGIHLPQGADIVLHGGYAFSNLFEQNIAEQIEADISFTTPPFWGFHGNNGPYNTFVRNIVVEGNPASNPEFHELILKNAEFSNLIGNVITDINTSGITSIAQDLYGREVLENQNYETGSSLDHPTGIFEFFAMINNQDIWQADVSYYYSSRPDFLSGGYNFPTLGPGEPFNSNFPPFGHIPASARWFNSGTRFEMAEPTPFFGDTLTQDITLSGTIYFTNDISIPVNRTLSIEPNSSIHFADKDTITLSIEGALSLGSNVRLQTGENGNGLAHFSGNTTLTIPSGVAFQVLESSDLNFNLEVDIADASFLATANSDITLAQGGSISNSLFVSDPTATVRLQYGSNNLSVTESEFRHPLPGEELLAKRSPQPIVSQKKSSASSLSSAPSKENLKTEDPNNEIPKEYSLAQNFPNPFNPSTTIEYALPKESYVTLKVYNVLGQEVRTLVNRPQSAGYKTVQWDGKNESGETVAGGIYIYRLIAGERSANLQNEGERIFVKSDKMIFLK